MGEPVNMAAVVEQVLREEAEREAKYKSIEVTKAIDVDIDAGNLCAIDANPIEIKEFRSNRERQLKALARDGAQLLINQVFQLPVDRVDDAVIAKLPDPRTILPREKPVPKAKQSTKWEAYAQLKGINKKKKGRIIWDDELQEYRPRWGYNRANDQLRDWAIDVPSNLDPNTDMFAKRRNEKKEKIAKNELQRLRNIARNMKGKVPGVGLTPNENPDKDAMSRAASHARVSTASVGKFDRSIKNEKLKNMGRKRKFESNEADVKGEKKRSLGILDKLHNGPVLDTARAVNQLQASEERARHWEEKNGKGKKRGKSGSKPGQNKKIRRKVAKTSKKRAKGGKR